MRAVDFPEANMIFGKPDGMTDEQCSGVSAFLGVQDDGIPFVSTVWMPNKEDIDAINAGRPIILKAVGTGMPPVCLFTMDEKGESNQ